MSLIAKAMWNSWLYCSLRLSLLHRIVIRIESSRTNSTPSSVFHVIRIGDSTRHYTLFKVVSLSHMVGLLHCSVSLTGVMTVEIIDHGTVQQHAKIWQLSVTPCGCLFLLYGVRRVHYGRCCSAVESISARCTLLAHAHRNACFGLIVGTSGPLGRSM